MDAGYEIVVTAQGEQVKDLIDGQDSNVLSLSLDVTDRDQIRNAVAATISKFGRIDVLVNNAGIG
ncbi:SDR family oxidoreductase [Paenibacillus sp. DR312]|uniref:SDR family oxidoreductase n=1 Tax=Paenibacillus sp. DR312 TaxID=2871175 RepID=UPI0021BBB749|nr:SDR family oxidoreductase [Paenibacillus sp. DR312]